MGIKTNKYTVILKMPDGTYHCVLCPNIKTLVLSDNPYTNQKRNQGKKELVFSVKGDYCTLIKKFGIKKFVELLNAYDPIGDDVRRMLY